MPGGALTCDSTLDDACASAWGNPLGYTGRPLSSLSGLYDMRARHYDPHLRQWTSPDPMGYVDGFDVWGYVAGDALNYIDPYGLFGRNKSGSQGPPRSNPHLPAQESDGGDGDGNGDGVGSPPSPDWERRRDHIVNQNESKKHSHVKGGQAISGLKGANSEAEACAALKTYGDVFGVKCSADGTLPAVPVPGAGGPPTPPRKKKVKPGDLRLPAGTEREDGPDTIKLNDQYNEHGSSQEGMPPIIVREGKDGELEILDGVTRASRIHLTDPDAEVEVVIDSSDPNLDLSRSKKVRDALGD